MAFIRASLASRLADASAGFGAFLLIVRLAGAAGFSSGLCASSSAELGGHACWSCGLTECEFLVLSQVVHVDVAIGLHPVFVGFDGEGADEA